MDLYARLAEELIEALDRKKKGPPHEDVSTAMRGELAVLRLLMDEGRVLTAGDISRLLQMTTSRIAAVLGSLQKKGLIVRSTDAEDKRRVLVTLTQKGMTLCRKRKQHVVSDMSYMLSYLGENDAKEFVRLMKRVHDIIPPPSCIDEEEYCDKEENHEQ